MPSMQSTHPIYASLPATIQDAASPYAAHTALFHGFSAFTVSNSSPMDNSTRTGWKELALSFTGARSQARVRNIFRWKR